MFILKQKPQHNKDDSWCIAPWSGDPGRTLKIENAKQYQSQKGASIARTYYKARYGHIRNIDLEIVEVQNGRA